MRRLASSALPRCSFWYCAATGFVSPPTGTAAMAARSIHFVRELIIFMCSPQQSGPTGAAPRLTVIGGRRRGTVTILILSTDAEPRQLFPNPFSRPACGALGLLERSDWHETD